MELRFITATKTNGVYNVADFWVFSAFPVPNWQLVAGTDVDYNFTADDSVASLVVNNSDMNYRIMTHMLVPSVPASHLDKIYEISGYEYINKNQTRLILTEDALIGAWPTLKSKKLRLSRTNDELLFKGVHDIENTAINYSSEIDDATSGQTGKWVLLTYQPSGAALTLNFDTFGGSSSSFEFFPLLADVIAKYPEEATAFPNEFYYLDKVVDTGAGFYQCIYDATNARLKWVPFIGIGGPESFTLTLWERVMSPSDIPIIHAIVPLSSRIRLKTAGGLWQQTPSFYDMVRVLDARIISLRLIDETLIPGFSSTYVVGDYYQVETNTVNVPDATASFLLGQMATFEEDKAISFAPTVTEVSVYSYEPFCEYTLSVYGVRYKLNRRMINSNLRFRYQYSSTSVNYVVYYNHIGNVLMQGNLNLSGITASDKYAEFLLTNSTYNQVKMINNIGGFVERSVMGAAASVMMGNPTGAVMGLASGLISTGLNMANQKMQEQAMRDAPDTMKGQNNDLIGIMNGLFGIFLIKRVAGSDYLEAMRYNYALRGHPTMTNASIDDLTAVADAFYSFGNVKLVYGECKEIIINQFITAMINDKLREGVIFIV